MIDSYTFDSRSISRASKSEVQDSYQTFLVQLHGTLQQVYSEAIEVFLNRNPCLVPLLVDFFFMWKRSNCIFSLVDFYGVYPKRHANLW